MATSITNHRIRFMDNNLAELSTGQVDVSSELSAFPATNAYQNKFRSKVWKPSGHFLIEADVNDKFYINDGSDKTIIISASSYTSPDLLRAELETQLNSSSSGWTVSYNSVDGEYRFSFSHASTHTIKLSNSTEAIWDTIGFTQTSDQTVNTELFADEQRNHTSEYITFDLGYNATIEFFGLISPLDEEFSVSETSTLKLYANNIDEWDAPPLDITLTRSDGGVYKFLDDIDDTDFRFWRFELIDKDNTDGPTAHSFGYIYVGDYTTLEDRNINIGFRKEIVDPSVRQISESGAMYWDRKTKYINFKGHSINYLSKDQRDDLEQFFHDFGGHTPFFVSLDPTLCFSNELFDMTKYVVFDGNVEFRHVIRDLFNMSFAFREVL